MLFCVNCKKKIKNNKNLKFRILHLRNRDVKMYSHLKCNIISKEDILEKLQTVWYDNKKYLYDKQTSEIYYWRKKVFNFHQPSKTYQKEIRKNMKIYNREIIVKATMEIYQKISQN